jgi:hypothetical protein
MKVSLTKFYHEVTGNSTTDKKLSIACLDRWQVPYDKDAGKRDVVDVKYLGQAAIAHKAEQDEREAKRKAREPKPKAEEHHMIRDEVLQKLDDIETRQKAMAVAVGRLESIVNRIGVELGVKAL